MGRRGTFGPVSYTHLDVYKRQLQADLAGSQGRFVTVGVWPLEKEMLPDRVVDEAIGCHADTILYAPGGDLSLIHI